MHPAACIIHTAWRRRMVNIERGCYIEKVFGIPGRRRLTRGTNKQALWCIKLIPGGATAMQEVPSEFGTLEAAEELDREKKFGEILY